MPRVFLRPPTLDDAPRFCVLARASLERDRPVAAPPRTSAQFARYLARATRIDFDARLICLAETGELLGMINLSQIALGFFRSAYLGYWIAQAYEGQGLMREAIERMLRHVFVTRRLHRVEANIQPQNQRSLGLVKALGFRREGYSPRYLKIGGEWRDHERWAMTLEDWRARAIRVTGSKRPRSARRGRSGGRSAAGCNPSSRAG